MPATNFQATGSVGVSWQWQRAEKRIKRKRRASVGEKEGSHSRSGEVCGHRCHSMTVDFWFWGWEYHPSCSVPGAVWLQRHKYAWFLSSFLSFPPPPLPHRGPPSPLFYPELLDSWGEVAFLSLLHLPASRSMIAPHPRRVHPWLYCVDRVVNYLLLSRLMKSNVFFFLAAAHLTLPSSPPTPFLPPSHQPFVRAPLHGIVGENWLGENRSPTSTPLTFTPFFLKSPPGRPEPICSI